MKKIALGIASALFFFAFPASATIIHVPQDQPTIQMAIDSAISGDTVLVAPGTYTENLIVNGKNIKLISANGPEETVITRAIAGVPVVKILNTDLSSSLEGFTIQNGIGDGLADGVFLSASSALIKNNLIKNNSGSLGAGLFSWNGGSPRIVENTFRLNGGSGRTVEFANVNPLLERNLIAENFNDIAIFIVGNITALNNTIARNSQCKNGFFLNCATAISRITNNVITDNTQYGIQGCFSPGFSISYNNFFANSLGPYPNGTPVGPGNIYVDPAFVGGQPFDYRLQVSSPCIDAGDPSTLVPPGGGTRVDIGAFEFPKNNSAPTIPQPVLPSNGAEANGNTFLIWQRSRDQEGNQIRYTLQIDNDSSFATPIITADSIPDSNVLNLAAFGNAFSYAATSTNFVGVKLNTLTGFNLLLDDSTYYWRVKATDIYGQDSGYSSGSKYFVLNLVNSPPRPVTAGFSPANGVYENDLTPEISWFPASDPDPSDNPSTLHYNLQLDDDGEFSVDVRYQYATSAGQTSFFVTDSLTDNRQWYYRVQTVDDEGATSSYSAIQNFFTNSRNNPPSSFSLVSPSTDSKLFSKTPTLDWADAIDPDPLDSVTYSVIIDADSLFGNPNTISQLPASSYTVASGLLSRGNRYFWKVKATDSRDSSTFSTEVFKFRVLQLGDANGDGLLTSADIVLILNFVFLGIPITPPEVADMNCDGNATASDVVIALNTIFLGQPPPCDP